jgi:hypothetical protein
LYSTADSKKKGGPVAAAAANDDPSVVPVPQEADPETSSVSPSASVIYPTREEAATIKDPADVLRAYKIFFKAVANTAIAIDSKVSNEMPLLRRMLAAVDFDAPLFNPYMQPEKGRRETMFGFYVSVDGSKINPDATFGRHVHAFIPSRVDEYANEHYKRHDVETYSSGRAEDGHTFLPVGIEVDNWQRLPKTNTELLNALNHDGYKIEKDEKDPENMHMAKKTFTVRFDVWSNHIRRSGIAGFDAWRDVNVFEPIPLYAVTRFKEETVGSDLKMDIVECAWDMEQYLRLHGVPITHIFAKELLGGTGRVEKGNIGVEKHKNEPEPVPVVNLSNKELGTTHLLNASEWTGDLQPYLDPANKWIPVVLVVPMQPKCSKLPAQRQTKLFDSLNKLKEASTPEEGVYAFEVFKSLHASSAEIKELDGIVGDFRFIVFFMKPLTTLFSEEDLSKKFYTPAKGLVELPVPVAPVPAPAPAEASVKQETPAESSNNKRQREEVEEKPLLSNDDALSGENNNDEPPQKKARLDDGPRSNNEDEDGDVEMQDASSSSDREANNESDDGNVDMED